jgi:hypothetical protein
MIRLHSIAIKKFLTPLGNVIKLRESACRVFIYLEEAASYKPASFKSDCANLTIHRRILDIQTHT